jgi:SWI/SNF-related matrix-associated actin-dependent regulator 1 of chromatin subfamily A
MTSQADKAVELGKKVGAHNYQQKGIKWLCEQKSCLLADDQGLGKTLQLLIAHDESYGLLVVAPSHLKLNWRVETEKWRPDLTVTVLKNGKYFKYPEPGEVVITTYGLMPWWLLLPPRKRKNLMMEPEEIEAAKQVVVIYDEAQALKSPKTKQSKKARELSKYVHKSILVTGTPVMNREQELWYLFHAIRLEKEVFGSFINFLRLFRGRKVKFGFEFHGPRPEVPKLLQRFMLRRTKKEVDIELPDKIYKVVYVEVSSKAQKELSSIWDVYRRSKYFSDEELPPIEEMSKAKKALAASKIPVLKEVVKSLQERGIAPLVFSAHRDPIESLGKMKGWGSITGKMTSKQKHDVATNFQNGKYKGLAATILAAGTGLTLTYTDHVVFNDPDWVPANNLQAEDRAHRIGQTSDKVVYYHLVADHPLDRHIHKLILKKMQLSKDTLEVKEEPPEETKTDQEMRTEAILSRLKFWEDLSVSKNWRVRAPHKKIIIEESEKIVGRNKIFHEKQPEETSPYSPRDVRILNLLLIAGLGTQKELRIAAGILNKYQDEVSAPTKKMLKGIDTT